MAHAPSTSSPRTAAWVEAARQRVIYETNLEMLESLNADLEKRKFWLNNVLGPSHPESENLRRSIEKLERGIKKVSLVQQRHIDDDKEKEAALADDDQKKDVATLADEIGKNKPGLRAFFSGDM